MSSSPSGEGPLSASFARDSPRVACGVSRRGSPWIQSRGGSPSDWNGLREQDLRPRCSPGSQAVRYRGRNEPFAAWGTCSLSDRCNHAARPARDGHLRTVSARRPLQQLGAGETALDTRSTIITYLWRVVAFPKRQVGFFLTPSWRCSTYAERASNGNLHCQGRTSFLGRSVRPSQEAEGCREIRPRGSWCCYWRETDGRFRSSCARHHQRRWIVGRLHSHNYEPGITRLFSA